MNKTMIQNRAERYAHQLVNSSMWFADQPVEIQNAILAAFAAGAQWMWEALRHKDE